MRQLKRAYPGKVGTGFPKRICANSSAHIPEKWAPVFRKGYAPTQARISRKSGHRFSEKDMRQLKSAYPGKVGTGFPKRICANSRAHIPEKWAPVFRKGYAQTQEVSKSRSLEP